VDGNGFYAGRLETDGERLYVVGWNGTKVDHQDENNYDWAGNAVIHQLEQNPDGTLKPVVNESVKKNTYSDWSKSKKVKVK
jgi:beta-fructofuranosidase